MPVAAQDAPADQAGASVEIVVTAQRRNESLQQVPISISALSNETMERQGVRSINDIARLTPALSFNSGGDRGLNTIAIRGIESSGGASTTGLYIDDVPIQARRVGYGGGSPFPRIFDLSRVEVLRGPQGTLFGAGSQGGTVRFITTPPSVKDWSGYARGELSSTEHGAASYEAGAAIGGPVSDKIGFRTSAWYRRDGGYVDRVDFRNRDVLDRNANSVRTLVLSAAVKFQPTDDIEITPSVFYQDEHRDDVSSFWTSLSQSGNGIFRNGNVLRAPTTDRFVVPSLNVQMHLGAADIVSVTSYMDRKNVIVADYTEAARAALFSNPFPPVGVVGPNTFTNTQRSFTQEVRLQSVGNQRLRWVLGIFYQHSKQNSTQYDDDPSLNGEFFNLTGLTLEQALGQAPIDGRYIYVQDPYRGVDKQIAGFGQVDFDLTEKLTLTAGLRVARTKFNTTTTVSGPFGGTPFTDGGKQSETPITPKIGVQYKLDGGNNVYATVAKGFRVGGYNPRQLSICQAQLASLGLDNGSSSYKSDEVWSYEVGSKNQFFGRRLTVNGSMFYIKWKDIQQFVNLASCNGGFIANLGEATSKGFDLQLEVRPTNQLTLGANIGYTHGEFNQTTGLGGVSAVTNGDRLPGSPWKIAISGEYRAPIGSAADAYLRADYQYASAEPNQLAPNNPANGLNFVPGYYVRPTTNFVSLRTGIRKDALEVSLFADNLFDDGTITERVPMPVTVEPFRANTYRPRTIGLTISYRYR
jgi:outer membrane receptor protein involved in Fe transport